MLHSSRDKQEIVRTEFAAFFRANELAIATDDNINFIAGVWSLRIVPARRVKLYLECPVLKKGDGSFSLRFRQPRMRFVDSNRAR